MVNNNQLIDDKDIYRKVGYANEIKCSKCKKYNLQMIMKYHLKILITITKIV